VAHAAEHVAAAVLVASVLVAAPRARRGGGQVDDHRVLAERAAEAALAGGPEAAVQGLGAIAPRAVELAHEGEAAVRVELDAAADALGAAELREHQAVTDLLDHARVARVLAARIDRAPV